MMFRFFSKKTAFLVVLAITFAENEDTRAQDGLWRTYTDMRQIRQLAAAPNLLLGATDGGLLTFSPAENTFAQLTNADGLFSNEITAVSADRLGRIWAAFSNGFIDIIDLRSGSIKLLVDYRRTFINQIVAKGDTIYLALDSGVAEYRLSKEEPKELYRKLGTFSSKIAVQHMLVYNDQLYAATAEGLAIADLRLPNLQAPQSWRNRTTADGLPARQVNDLAIFSGKVLAATPLGLAIEEGERWQAISSIPDQNIQSVAVRQTLVSTEVFISAPSGMYVSTDLNTWQQLPSLPAPVLDLQVFDGVLFGALPGTGLVEFHEASGSWRMHQPEGPKNNLYSSLFFDQQKQILWCASPNAGVFAFDGQKWFDFATLGALAVADYRAIVVDTTGKVWCGTWGKGLIVLNGGINSASLTKIDTVGGFLAGSTSENAAFVAINDVTMDRHGNIWLSNVGALSGRAIVAVTPDGRWAYFSTSFGLATTKINTILVDQFDRVWYGTETNGVQVMDYGGTLFDPTDDRLALGLVPIDKLSSTRVTSLAEDLDGTIWIGTPDGLYYYFSGEVFRFFGAGGEFLINEEIRAIGVDPANNKWIGTAGGISVISADNFTLNAYTTDDSPLVSNSITDFAFNAETGETYIASTNGLSVLQTPFTAPKPNFSQLQGYPNPLRLAASGSRFVIKNLVRRAGLKIFTENGLLIRNYPPGSIAGAQAVWDGRDAQGRLVPSGIYIYVAYTEAGENAAGKVAVVRE